MSSSDFESFLNKHWPFRTVRSYQHTMMNTIMKAFGEKKVGVVIAPTGLGKTAAYLAPVIYYGLEGKRTVISAPTTPLQEQVEKEMRKFKDLGITPVLVKGVLRYPCELKGPKKVATPKFCEENQPCSYRATCEYFKSKEATKEANIIITNHAYYLYHYIELKSDFLVIDESHGFEEAAFDKLRPSLWLGRFEKGYKRLKELHDQTGEESLKELMGVWDELEEAISFVPLKLRINYASFDPFVEWCDENNGTLDKAKLVAERYVEKDVEKASFYLLCIDLANFRVCLRDHRSYTFTSDGETQYAVPRRYESLLKRYYNCDSVILVSAIMQDANVHAMTLGLGDKEVISHPEIPYPLERQNRRLLLGITPAPTLRKEKTAESGFVIPKDERGWANEIILASLESIPVKTLVLFASRADSRIVVPYIKSHVRNRPFLEVGVEQEETDIIQGKIDRFQQENGIILLTASTKFWQGIDIRKLRMVIIDALPYPPLRELKLIYGDEQRAFDLQRLRMSARLQNGLGRIMRHRGDWGIGIVVDGRWSNRDHWLLKKLRREGRFPKHLYKGFKFLSQDDLPDSIQEFAKQFESS